LATGVDTLAATPGVTDAVAGRVRFAPAKALWFLGLAGLAVLFGPSTITPGALALFLVTTAATLCLGHSLGMHRRLIHRSFECSPALERVLVYFGVLVGIAGPLGMMRTHDLRDWAQRQPRCHDYFAHRRSMPVDAGWQLCCEIELDHPPVFTPPADVAGDRFMRFLERSWPLHQLPWTLLFLWLGGAAWVVWGVCARVAVCNAGHWFIGYLAHNRGHRRWHVDGASVQGYNVRFCGLVTMGECWHNNHHAFPRSARLGLAPGELDPGWWTLKALEACGVVRSLRTPDDLPPRAELRRLPEAPANVPPARVVAS
jgi:stearoyl-CoA desaturase (delta-9 desaturase)